jgi:membrane protease YdiL (CAAX protease family)
MPSERYLALGRIGKHSWWRYILGCFLILSSYAVMQTLSCVILIIVNGGKRLVLDPKTGGIVGISPIVTFLSLNLSLVVWILSIWLIVRLVHKRSFLSLITPNKRLNFGRIIFGLAIWTGLQIVINLIIWLVYPKGLQYSLRLPDFLYFVPAVLILTPIQCLGEEVFFRGYLLQGMSSLIKNSWVLAFSNGLLFMLPHLQNPEMANEPIVMPLFYLSIGFILAITTIRTNSLELAIGAHLANNLFAECIVGYAPSVLQTNTIFTRETGALQFELFVFFVLAPVFCWLMIKFAPLDRNSVAAEPVST